VLARSCCSLVALSNFRITLAALMEVSSMPDSTVQEVSVVVVVVVEEVLQPPAVERRAWAWLTNTSPATPTSGQLGNRNG
jgi:hypothetical protein